MCVYCMAQELWARMAMEDDDMAEKSRRREIYIHNRVCGLKRIMVI